MQQQIIETIKTIPILRVVQDTNLQPKANKICSPFTNEKTPSLHIYTDTNSFYDFSADRAGDVIELYMGLHQIPDFITACRRLANTYNIPLPPDEQLYSGNTKEEQYQKETLYLINQSAATHFAAQLANNQAALNYLTKERIFTAETIDYWQLGYDDGTLPKFLTQNQYNLEFGLLAGLLNAAQNSRFYKRITFPILNAAGKHIGFTARTIQANPNPETPKYLNTATTAVFEKKTVLYGLYQNKKDIKAAGAAILVEGATDVIALWQRGYKNAIATLDKNLTPQRVAELKKYTDTVIIWRDADSAGKNAALEDIKKLLAAGFTVKIIDPQLTKAKDPAEWATHAKTTEAMPPPQEAIIWYANEILPPTEGQPADRNKAIGELVSVVLCLPIPEQQGLYVEEVAKQHKIKAEYFYQKMKYNERSKPDAATQGATAALPPENSKRKPKYEDINSFKRVGVNYFKWVVVTNAKTKKPELTLEKWSPDIIKQDYCKRWKNFLDEIPAYDTFCVRPSFTNLQQSHIDIDPISGMVSHNYNLCKPLTYKPATGQFPTIKMFIQHIFGNEKSDWDNQETGNPLTMIIDCLRIKFQQPTHLLPVVCLLSKEQETGKSTFFDFMGDLFGSNAVTITKEHLESQFNTTYADRLVICAEEIKLTSKEVDLKNKLKHLATASKIFYNPKGVAQREIEYYGWLMMSSNHENDFMQLESDDKRFWITALKTIAQKDPNLRAKMVAEIPAFAHYCLNTAIVHPEESRIWFAPQYIHNEQRSRILWHSRSTIEKAINDAITNIFLTYYVTERNITEGKMPEIRFKCDLTTLIDLVNSHSRFKHDGTQIKDWLRDNKGIKPGSVGRYKIPIGYDETDELLYKLGHGRLIDFVYFDWVQPEELGSIMLKEWHQKTLAELNQPVPF